MVSLSPSPLATTMAGRASASPLSRVQTWQAGQNATAVPVEGVNHGASADQPTDAAPSYAAVARSPPSPLVSRNAKRPRRLHAAAELARLARPTMDANAANAAAANIAAATDVFPTADAPLPIAAALDVFPIASAAAVSRPAYSKTENDEKVLQGAIGTKRVNFCIEGADRVASLLQHISTCQFCHASIDAANANSGFNNEHLFRVDIFVSHWARTRNISRSRENDLVWTRLKNSRRLIVW